MSLVSGHSRIDAANVRAFLGRPWGELARLREQHWRDALLSDPLATFRASEALWQVLLLRAFLFTPHIRCRGEEAKAIKDCPGFKARRWVVERTHSWMNRFRRILVRWEKRADTYVAMLHFACSIITWKSCGLVG